MDEARSFAQQYAVLRAEITLAALSSTNGISFYLRMIPLRFKVARLHRAIGAHYGVSAKDVVAVLSRKTDVLTMLRTPFVDWLECLIRTNFEE